ncbi:hypothetical protein WJ542_19220 [Paraburkholderia sp. B3]
MSGHTFADCLRSSVCRAPLKEPLTVAFEAEGEVVCQRAIAAVQPDEP